MAVRMDAESSLKIRGLMKALRKVIESDGKKALQKATKARLREKQLKNNFNNISHLMAELKTSYLSAVKDWREPVKKGLWMLLSSWPFRGQPKPLDKNKASSNAAEDIRFES